MLRRQQACSAALGALAIGLLLAGTAHAHDPGLDKELPSLPMYLRLGFEHILSGADHLAFLLGLVIVSTSLRSSLLAVTAFTLAHSCSLALSIFGVVAPSPTWVEPAIALSVAYVGLENYFVRDGSKRFRLSFVFGFVHGFGFAGALQEIGVPPDRAPAALALFNLGVELGQLAVLAALLPLLAWLRRGPRVWPTVSRGLNAVLVIAGLFWAAQRALGVEAQPQLTASVSTPAARPAGWQARLLENQACRSSLECQPGLHCSGVGADQAGVCVPPKRPGEKCGATQDKLASYLPLSAAEHRECADACVRGRCSAVE
jgi:hydrogenase/urease accessory protein HupE